MYKTKIPYENIVFKTLCLPQIYNTRCVESADYLNDFNCSTLKKTIEFIGYRTKVLGVFKNSLLQNVDFYTNPTKKESGGFFPFVIAVFYDLNIAFELPFENMNMFFKGSKLMPVVLMNEYGLKYLTYEFMLKVKDESIKEQIKCFNIVNESIIESENTRIEIPHNLSFNYDRMTKSYKEDININMW